VISGSRSRISKTRSKLTSAVRISSGRPDTSFSGSYSCETSAMNATSVPTWNTPCTTSVPPSPYTRAVTSAASSEMNAKSSSIPATLATARSRIRVALRLNSPASSSGRPYSMASSAPDTSDRSAVIADSSPRTCISARSNRCDRFPATLPGSTNSGITTSATRLSCHDSQNIAASTRTRFSSTDSDW
jgi:hypothetical protein